MMDMLNYPKPMLITDAAVNIYPSLGEETDIAHDAIDLAHLLADGTGGSAS